MDAAYNRDDVCSVHAYRCTARTLSEVWRSRSSGSLFSDGDLNKVSCPLMSGVYSICPFARNQARQLENNLQKCPFGLKNRLKKLDC